MTADLEADREVRIVRLFSRLNIGGPSIHVILLTAGLRQRGYRTRLVVGQETAEEGNLLDLARDKAVTCEPLPSLGREIRPFSDLAAFFSLYRLIRAFRPSIVHTHAAKAGLLGRLAARLAGVPVVVHTFHGHVLRGYFGPVKTAIFRRIEALLARVSDVLLAVSEAVREDLEELREDREELAKDREELRKDRAERQEDRRELRRDKAERRQDVRELRRDRRENRRDVRQDQHDR